LIHFRLSSAQDDYQGYRHQFWIADPMFQIRCCWFVWWEISDQPSGGLDEGFQPGFSPVQFLKLHASDPPINDTTTDETFSRSSLIVCEE
jgi:hypothetical protein